MKKFWQRMKFWQKGAIIGLIFVIIIYIPVMLTATNACKPVSCGGEACILVIQPVNPEACHFWQPIFIVLLIPALIFWPVLSIDSNLQAIIIPVLYILYFCIGGYIIGRSKRPIKQKDKVSKAFKVGILAYLIGIVSIFIFAKVHNDMIERQSLDLTYFLILLFGSLSLAVFFFIAAFIISYALYSLKEKKPAK